MVRYVTVSELIYINGRVLNDARILSGQQQIREIERLDAAAGRPAASAFGADAYPELRQKAAVLFHSIARNHPFKDGNKRTATVALLFMLAANGQQVAWEREDALETVLDVAEGRADYPHLAAWLPLQAAASEAREPNETQDTLLIDRLLDQHRWLLHELAER